MKRLLSLSGTAGQKSHSIVGQFRPYKSSETRNKDTNMRMEFDAWTVLKCVNWQSSWSKGVGVKNKLFLKRDALDNYEGIWPKDGKGVGMSNI